MANKWKSHDGRVLAVYEMATEHVINAMTMLLNAEIRSQMGLVLSKQQMANSSEERRAWIRRFYRELEKRRRDAEYLIVWDLHGNM